MTNDSRSRGRWVRPMALIAATVGVAALATGCDKDDRAQTTIAEASHVMSAINAGGGSTATAPHREDAYERVISMLRPIVSSADGAEKAAAQSIMAQAMAGKGRIESARAADLESSCAGLISSAQNAADLFVAHSGLSTALIAHDTQPEFEDIRQRATEVEEEIEAIRARIRQIDERVGQLQQRSDAARDEAQTRRRHESQLRSQAVDTGADERAELITEAVSYQREGDEYEAQVVMIDAGVDQLRRTKESVQADLDRLVTQRSLLEGARSNAELRAGVASDQSKSAGDAAFEAARRLRSIVREIETMRTGELAEAYTQAQETLEGAEQAIRAGSRAGAGDGGKNTNSVYLGLINQALGDLHDQRATGAAGYASLLNRLMEIQPELPDRGDYRAMLDRTRASRGEALAAASEAYTQAADALERVRGTDAMQRRVEAIVTSLRSRTAQDGGGGAGEVGAGEVGG